MKINKLVVMVTSGVMLVGLTSCAQEESFSSLPPTKDSVSGDGPKVVEATPRVTLIDNSASSDQASYDARSDVDNILSTRLIYFDFDSKEIRPEFGAVLSAHADYLISNRNSGVTLQGHADERGSTEYNLSLGQDRADAVRDVLVANGVFPDQIETISYGEERPRALGSNEGAWAENRRVEIVYTDE